jgi:hypothetical protein
VIVTPSIFGRKFSVHIELSDWGMRRCSPVLMATCSAFEWRGRGVLIGESQWDRDDGQK